MLIHKLNSFFDASYGLALIYIHVNVGRRTREKGRGEGEGERESGRETFFFIVKDH